MTAYEGNKLMRKGKGVLALRHAAMSSSIGGVLGALMLMVFAPAVAAGRALFSDSRQIRVDPFRTACRDCVAQARSFQGDYCDDPWFDGRNDWHRRCQPCGAANVRVSLSDRGREPYGYAYRRLRCERNAGAI